MTSWKKEEIEIADGTKVLAQMPVIVSASRSTDIPAFYSDWFMERLKAGYVKWFNPFNGVPLYVGKGGVNAREFTPDEMCTVARRIGYVDAGRVCDAERRKVAQTFRPRFHTPRRFAILFPAMLGQSFTEFIFATNTDGRCQNYKQAEEVLSRVKKEKYRNDQVYLSWFCRCYIMNDKPDLAWNLYISIENHLVAVYILNFIAHELYRMGHFYFSFKAFLFLEKFSPSDENTRGKVSSAIGVFYLLLSEKISSDRLQEVIHYLCDGPQNLEVNKALKVFKTWGKENGIDFTDEPVIDEA